MDRDYHIRIADFGISRVKSVSCAMTQCGTPKYMAPEVFSSPLFVIALSNETTLLIDTKADKKR